VVPVSEVEVDSDVESDVGVVVVVGVAVVIALVVVPIEVESAVVLESSVVVASPPPEQARARARIKDGPARPWVRVCVRVCSLIDRAWCIPRLWGPPSPARGNL